MPTISVANTTANLTGKTLLVADQAATVTGLLTFNRGGNAPFAVAGGAALVTNLDADKLDGQEGSYYLDPANLSAVVPMSKGGLAVALADPNADRVLFWDDSAGQYAYLTMGTNLSISGTTLNATGITTAADLPTSGEWPGEDVTVSAGGGSEAFKLSGLIDTDDTQAATGADTTETVLRAFTVPANTLNANGRTLRVRAVGTFGGNANDKTVRIRFGGIGGTVVASIAGAFNGSAWIAEAYITRIASNSQRGSGYILTPGNTNASTGTTVAAPAQTDSGAIDISITGQNGTASASDIVYEASTVEMLN